jgi:hypothetical protein
MAYSPKNPNGQATMANSEPVVIASDQTPVDVDVVTSVLPTGASTSANQTTIIGHLDGVEGLLTSIEGDTSAIQTAVQLLDDTVQVLGTDTYTEAVSKGITLGAVRRDADTTLVGTTNEFGPLQMDANGRLKVEVFSGETLPISGTISVNALPAGSNNIGDVDVLTLPALPTGSNTIGSIASITTSIVPGTGATNLGKAIDTTTGATDTGVLLLATRDDDLTTLTPVDGDNVQLRVESEGALWTSNKPTATEGVLTMNASSSDGATALTNSAQAIKASAGCLYGYYIYNPNATAAFVQFYNTASGSVTVGTTSPLFMLTIPATSGANLFSNTGIQFSTAMSWAATSTAGGNGALGTALDAVAWYK